MSGVKAFRALLLVVLVTVAVGAEEVQGPVHHVVGGNRRWDTDSDIGSWLSGRVFRVGDKIWFTYSVPQESVVELQSFDEFQSCDISNPIKMYTDGVNQIPLEREGNRYFVIGNQENCNNGLKLHIDVKPSETQPLPNPWPQPFSIFSPPPPLPWASSPPPPLPWASSPPPPLPWASSPPPPHPWASSPPPPHPWASSPPPPHPWASSPPPPHPWVFSPPPPEPKPFPPPEPKPSPPPPEPKPPKPSPPPPEPKPPKPSPPPPEPKPSPPPPKPSPPPPEPKPEPEPVPDTPPPPSGSTQLNGLSFGLFGFLICSLGLSLGL